MHSAIRGLDGKLAGLEYDVPCLISHCALNGIDVLDIGQKAEVVDVMRAASSVQREGEESLSLCLRDDDGQGFIHTVVGIQLWVIGRLFVLVSVVIFGLMGGRLIVSAIIGNDILGGNMSAVLVGLGALTTELSHV